MDLTLELPPPVYKVMQGVKFSEVLFGAYDGDYGDVLHKNDTDPNDWVQAVSTVGPTSAIIYSEINGRLKTVGNVIVPMGKKLLLFKVIPPPTFMYVAAVTFMN